MANRSVSWTRIAPPGHCMTDPHDAPPAPMSLARPEADLWIAEVHVSNFRNLVDVRIPLEKGATFLVGENNAGKSSFLLAIAAACGSYQPSRDDLHRTIARTEDEAIVDLIIRPADEKFNDVVTPRLSGNSGPGPKPGEWTGIRTRMTGSKESSSLALRRTYLSWDASTQDWTEMVHSPNRQVRELLAAHLVEASRDLSSDVRTRNSDWGRVLTDLGVNAAARKDLEDRLADLGRALQEKSPTFSKISTELVKVKNTLPEIGEVQLQPLPGSIEDLARSVDIVVRASSEKPALPMHLQGLGSRSLAALRVVQVLCQLRVGADQGVRPQMVTLLEEPEAHLHPQAQAGVVSLIDEIPGQAVVATHSSALIGEADLHAVRIIRSSDEGTTVHRLDRETDKKIAIFQRYISRPLGELFFSRMVIFVDGTSEKITLPVLLSPLLGRDISAAGVTILDMEGQSKQWFGKVVEALGALGGIPWLVFLDNDPDGLKSISGHQGSDGNLLSDSHPQVVLSGRKQLEQLLLDAGYGPEISTIANEHDPFLPPHTRADQPRLPPYASGVESEYLKFLKESKGWSGRLIAHEAMRNGRTAPGPVIELARRIRSTLNLAEPDTEEYHTASGKV